jgi:hypothetical protein
MKNVDRTKYQRLRDEGKLNCTIKEAVAKATRRLQNRPENVPREGWQNRLRRKYVHYVPVRGNADRLRTELLTVYDAPENRRKQNWDTPLATIKRTASYTKEVNHGKYSSRCTYNRYTYNPVISSYAWVDHNKRLAFQFSTDKVRRIKAPFGYFWDIDHHGVRLVSRGNHRTDYHVNASDLLDLTPRQIAAKLRGNETVRKAERKKARQEAAERKRRNLKEAQVIRNAEKEGARVCLLDSLKVGHCKVGTISWIRQHQLNPDLHYKPTQLLRIANGDRARVALVVAYSLRRHRKEMEQGYANLADHVLSEE